MFKKFLLSVFLFGFVFACSTTPKDTADSSGSGSSGEFNTATSEDESSASTAIDTSTSDFSGIVGGSYAVSYTHLTLPTICSV